MEESQDLGCNYQLRQTEKGKKKEEIFVITFRIKYKRQFKRLALI